MTLEIIIIVVLILIGVALMMAEIFLLPGITIAGIAGGLLMISSVVYAFHYIGNTAGYITIGTNIVLAAGAFMFLIKSKSLDRISLHTNIESVVDQSELKSLQIGDKGVAISRLNPIGKAEFGETIVEAKSFTGEFIDSDEIIEIVKIGKSNVQVQPCQNTENLNQ